MGCNRLYDGGKPLVERLAFQAFGARTPDQKVGAVRPTEFLRQRLGQKGRLVETAFQKPSPVQRDGGDQRVFFQKRSGGTGQPFRRRARNVVPVAMFQCQHHLASVIAIEKDRTALCPGPCNATAIVADFSLVRLARQRRAAEIAGQPLDKRCIAPARATQPEIAAHHVTATDAARRINQLQRRLKLHEPPPIVAPMLTPPKLTNRAALARARTRAAKAPEHFLHAIAADEIKDRLAMVNKSFNAPVIVTGHNDFWQDVIPGARIVADEELIDLEPRAHDLVIHAMALHWAHDPVGQMIQCQRTLEPDGLFLAVLFGGQTLHELRAALGQAEIEITGGLSPRVAPMAEIRDLGALLQRAGFALPVADSVPLTASYESPLHLMRELRAMGEQNALEARLRHFTRRDVIERAAEHYTAAFAEPDGRVRATFELIFLLGWAPDSSQPQPLRPGSAKSRLSEALGAVELPLKD